MNARFAETTRAIPALFQKLASSPYFVEKGVAAQKKKAGIYVFFENGNAIHVGRTRDLGRRLRGHVSRSHYSASFAFKRARRQLDRKATYTTKGSRADLLNDPEFAEAFYSHVELLKSLQVRFIEVKDPLQQYLLELYAALEYGLELDEFDTH